MLYVFSTNQVKLVARKSETTVKLGQRVYVVGCGVDIYMLGVDSLGKSSWSSDDRNIRCDTCAEIPIQVVLPLILATASWTACPTHARFL